MSQLDACRKGAGDYPTDCGYCDPTKCHDPTSSFYNPAYPNMLPSLTYAGNNNNPASAFPLGLCQGDCDTDADCANNRRCFQRDNYTPVPGCVGSGVANTDYCTDKPNLPPSLTYKGNNYVPASAFPLHKCQGDCDVDTDCVGTLVCLQRSAGQVVPGCIGSDASTTSYCVDYSARNNGASPALTKGVALKMYWRYGYFWQEETIERKWCMKCDGGSNCKPGQGIFVTNCDTDVATGWGFLVATDGSIMIKMASATANLCIQAYQNARFLTVQTCDEGAIAQRFRSIGGQRVVGDKFELRPLIAPTMCVTQDHHPKQGEYLGLWNCSIPEGDTTNFWNIY
jgi:hypothetical protein